MTASELKVLHERYNPNSYFFDRKTMRFFGDTMHNYGIKVWNADIIELYRRHPVLHGLSESTYFSAKNFKRLHLSETEIRNLNGKGE